MIACCCITWNRPRELGRLIECFRRQDYADKFLCVLDDSGQYPYQPSGVNWQVVSFNRRFRTIGEKRTACAGLTPPEAVALMPWDDDDLYLSGALTACMKALDEHRWAQARLVIEEGDSGEWYRQETFGRVRGDHSDTWRCAYHGGWCYRREAYQAVGGYPPQADEDWPLAERLLRVFGPSADSTSDGRPWLAYSRGPGHLSTLYQEHGGGKDCFAKAWDQKSREKVRVVPEEEFYSLIRLDEDYEAKAAAAMAGEVRQRPW